MKKIMNYGKEKWIAIVIVLAAIVALLSCEMAFQHTMNRERFDRTHAIEFRYNAKTGKTELVNVEEYYMPTLGDFMVKVRREHPNLNVSDEYLQTLYYNSLPSCYFGHYIEEFDWDEVARHL